jgi:hypothetical protein
MNEKRNVKLRDALLKALAVATFSAVSATAFTPVAQARVLLDDVNNGTCDLGADDNGSGTAADPYRISTVEDLAEVGDCDYDGDYYYSLENDLDISPDDNYTNDGTDWNTTSGGWQPIGEYWDYDFSGHFDGNGHTISGLEIDNSIRDNDYTGLFSEMNQAVIKDLTIVGEIDADENDYIGILAGVDDDSQISNVHIDADITEGDNWVGGLLGWGDGTRMSNITTTGDVFAIDEGDYVGGIVGWVTSDSYEPSLVDSSSDVNVNDVDDTDYDNEYVGGLVGEANQLRLLRSSFHGVVKGTDNVGGLVGDSYDLLVHDSHVTVDAEIVVNSVVGEDSDNIGGLVGYSDASSISSSSFHGTIDTGLGQAVEDIGGIVGDAEQSFIMNVYVASTANISIIGTDGNGANDVGGIVGEAFDSSISGAAMYADITAVDFESVGGLVGELEESSVDSSVNRGNVSVTLDDSDFDRAGVGGLVGEAFDFGSVTNSTNKGDVTVGGLQDTYAVGGLVGFIGVIDTVQTALSVTDNYNTGDVSGDDNVAGVIGSLSVNGTVVERNFSLGKLTSTGMEDPDGIATLREEVVVVPPAPQPIGDGGELVLNEPSNVVLDSDRADNETGATVLSAAELKTASELVALGWAVNDADRADWELAASFNSGFPHLAWETVSEDIDAEIGLMDTTFEEIITFLGAKRKTLRTYERNALNEVAELVNVNAYDNVEVHVYYGTKRKLAEKRGLNVKRWLVRQGVAQTITVYVHLTDNNNPIGSVTIEALVD